MALPWSQINGKVETLSVLSETRGEPVPLAIAMGDLPNTFQALVGTLVRFNGAIQTPAKLILILSG